MNNKFKYKGGVLYHEGDWLGIIQSDRSEKWFNSASIWIYKNYQLEKDIMTKRLWNKDHPRVKQYTVESGKLK